MKVFLDTDENYSVAGYNERASSSFGEIYLGLDKGPEYDRQSTTVNEAIQRITGAEAFGLALQETRRLLAANPDANDEDISIKVQAALCRHWFDLPDEINVVGLWMRDDGEINPPARCPGDFIYPSGYMFFPHPDPTTTTHGQLEGKILKNATMQFVDELRTHNKLPTGILSQAIFEAFPRGEDDLVAQTIIGVMIGMLPTVIINLLFTLEAWRENQGKVFAELQEKLRHHGGSDPFVRASEVLKQPLMAAMQRNPMPPAVWRTAVRDHTLGTNPPVQVNRGDKINVDIAAAT